MTNIETKVKNIIKTKTDLDVINDDLNLTLDDDLFSYGLDSYDVIRVLSTMEIEFGFRIKQRDLIIDNFRTLRKIIDFIQIQMNSKHTNKGSEC